MSIAPFQSRYSSASGGRSRCAFSSWSAQVAAIVTGWPSHFWKLPSETPSPDAPAYQPPTTGPSGVAEALGSAVPAGVASEVDGAGAAPGARVGDASPRDPAGSSGGTPRSKGNRGGRDHAVSSRQVPLVGLRRQLDVAPDAVSSR